MSKTTIIILILIALAVIIVVLKKQKETGSNKTQDELLNEMSHDELVSLAIAVAPPNTVASGMDGFNSWPDEHLRGFIRKFQK